MKAHQPHPKTGAKTQPKQPITGREAARAERRFHKNFAPAHLLLTLVLIGQTIMVGIMSGRHEPTLFGRTIQWMATLIMLPLLLPAYMIVGHYETIRMPVLIVALVLNSFLCSKIVWWIIQGLRRWRTRRQAPSAANPKASGSVKKNRKSARIPANHHE